MKAIERCMKVGSLAYNQGQILVLPAAELGARLGLTPAQQRVMAEGGLATAHPGLATDGTAEVVSGQAGIDQSTGGLSDFSGLQSRRMPVVELTDQCHHRRQAGVRRGRRGHRRDGPAPRLAHRRPGLAAARPRRHHQHRDPGAARRDHRRRGLALRRARFPARGPRRHARHVRPGGGAAAGCHPDLHGAVAGRAAGRHGHLRGRRRHPPHPPGPRRVAGGRRRAHRRRARRRGRTVPGSCRHLSPHRHVVGPDLGRRGAVRPDSRRSPGCRSWRSSSGCRCWPGCCRRRPSAGRPPSRAEPSRPTRLPHSARRRATRRRADEPAGN